MTAPTHVPIAGLLVPVQLVSRIIASFRGVYPGITDGKGDDAAVRAVLKYWVTATLEQWEGQKVQSEVVPAVEALQHDYAERADAARQKAKQDASLIVEAAPPPAPAPTASPDIV